MKITIESTDSEPRYSMKASVEVPYDDVLLDEAFELVVQVLEGYGYHYDSIKDAVSLWGKDRLND
jgi:hypothetical protein